MNDTRKSVIRRNTSETKIELELDLDNPGGGDLQSGSAFMDHMLDLFRKHGGFGLTLKCEGDSAIDMHHSVEDIAICLGEAIKECVGDKKGIERYGFYYVPMDEALARVVLDLSGRIAFEFNGNFDRDTMGNLETELVPHFFKSVAQNAAMNLHVDLIRGENTHHCIEAIFKSFARALAMAVGPSRKIKDVPSTKGVL